MSAPAASPASRRELKTRKTRWAQALASHLAARGTSPNAISLLSIGFAGAAMLLLMHAGDQTGLLAPIAFWLGALACIQLRLLCNLMDGMVAVEGRLGTATGAIFNEVPDRVADVLILVGAGYSGAGEPGVVKLFATLPLGWSAAIVALWTASIRLQGAALTGSTHDYSGPMAKQHRMAVLSAGILLELAQHLAGSSRTGILLALTLITAGGLWTCGRRLRTLGRALRPAGE